MLCGGGLSPQISRDFAPLQEVQETAGESVACLGQAEAVIQR